MSYFSLGQDGDPVSPEPLSAPAVGSSPAELLELASDPPELVGGDASTKQPPAPTQEDIDALYRAVRDYIGDAVIEELDFRMNRIIADYGRDVRTAAIAGAAADTGISIGLAFVPIVGPVLSLAYGVIKSLTGSRLQAQAMVILAETQQEAMILEATWNAKMQKLQEEVVKQETPGSIKLAIGLALGDDVVGAPVQGLGNVAAVLMALAAKRNQNFNRSLESMTPEEQEAAKAEQRKKVATLTAAYFGANPAAQRQLTMAWNRILIDAGYKEEEKSRLEKTVDKTKKFIKEYGYAGLFSATSLIPIVPTKSALTKVSAFGKGAAEYVSGHIIVTKAKEASRLILEQARLKVIAQYAILKSQLEDPEYRGQLRLNLAKMILENPEISKMLAQTILARQQKGDPVKPQEVPAIAATGLPAQKTKTALIAGGGVAAALALFLLR